MNKNIFYSFIVFATVALLGSCNKPENNQETGLTINEPVVTVPAEGGIFSVSYELENPAENGEMTVMPGDADWVSDFTVDESASVITFEVMPNETEEERSVDVSVSYTGLQSEAKFTVIQSGLSESPAAFVITPKTIDQTFFTVDVTPVDKEMQYILLSTTKSYIEGLNLTTDEALYEDDMLYIEATGKPISDFCVTGDLVDYKFNAYPGTEYVVYAYGVDVTTGERLTDIVYAYLTTVEVGKVNAEFDIEAIVNGTIAEVAITPKNGYDGYYYFEGYVTSSIDPSIPLFEICTNSFNSTIMYYQAFGYSDEMILSSVCSRGEASKIFELQPETTYTIVAYAVNEDLVVCSDPSTTEITTRNISPSDNVLTISVTDIEARSANVTITATNDNPYMYVKMEPDDIAEVGETDKEILDYILENYYLGFYSIGDESFSLTKLSPNTTYTICAFGYLSGEVTTGLFRKDFTTKEAVVGSVALELVCDKYYDIAEIWELDNSAVTGWDAYYDIYLPVVPVTTPADAEAELYYSVYGYDTYFDTASESELQDEVYYNACDGEPREPGYLLYTLDYDDKVIALGFAIDAEGNWGPLYKSEPFTVTANGVSDAREFIDLYVNGSQSVPVKVSTMSSESEVNVRGQELETSAKANDVSYNGKGLVVVRPADAPVSSEKQDLRIVSRRSLIDK